MDRVYAVLTTVKVKPGRIDDVAEMFRSTNPDLVAAQPAWRSARMLADREASTITVIAMWADADSYRRFSKGPLREAMAGFMPMFEGPPTVSLQEVLVDM